MNIIHQQWIRLSYGIMSHFNFILYRSFGPKPQAFPSTRNKHLNKRSVYVCMHLYVCFLGGHGNPLQYSCL